MNRKRTPKNIKEKYRLTELAMICLLRAVKNVLAIKNIKESNLMYRTVNKLRGIKPNIEIFKTTLADYIRALPNHLLEEVFQRFMRFEVAIEPHHLLPFILDDHKKLKLDFRTKDFDILYFLDLCSFKIRFLEELKLPRKCSMMAGYTETLRVISPKIKKLDLCQVEIGDDSMPTLAQLPLEELNLCCTSVSDDGIKELWDVTSKTKHKMKILEVAESLVSLQGYSDAIKELPMLQEIDCSCAALLSLTKDLISNNFRISTLTLDDIITNIERAVEIVAIEMPSVTSISLTSDGYSPKMLSSLTYVKRLTKLTLNSGLFLYNFHLASCINTYFVCLRDLTLYDYWNLWFDERDCQAFTIVAKCPKLQKLTFGQCDGLNNQIASKMALLLRNSELKNLSLKYCCGLGTYGIVAFLRITTLTRCEIILPECKMCDVELLQQAAQDTNVKLKIASFL